MLSCQKVGRTGKGKKLIEAAAVRGTGRNMKVHQDFLRYNITIRRDSYCC
jgi:hypothetical protein